AGVRARWMPFGTRGDAVGHRGGDELHDVGEDGGYPLDGEARDGACPGSAVRCGWVSESAGAARDAPDDLDEAEMHGEILLALARRGPVRAYGKDLAAHLVGDEDAGGGAMFALVVAPEAILLARGGGRISAREFTESGGVLHGSDSYGYWPLCASS